MKKLFSPICLLLLACFAATANAKPIALSYKALPAADKSVELRRIETIGYSSAAGTLDSTQLKIMGATGTGIFNGTTAAGLQTLGSRARPVLVTQAMTLPAAEPMDPAALGGYDTTPVVTGTPAAAAPDNEVLIVSEPPLLLLLVFGLLMAGRRRRG